MIKEKSPYLSNLPPVSIYSVETSRETSNTRQRKSLRKSLKVSTQKSLKKSKRSPRKSKGSRISTEHSPYAQKLTKSTGRLHFLKEDETIINTLTKTYSPEGSQERPRKDYLQKILDKLQLKKTSLIFKKLDYNNNGFLSLTELYDGFERLNIFSFRPAIFQAFALTKG